MNERDIEALALALFTLASQLERVYPGLAERHGWAEIADLKLFSDALQSASQATKPDGLQ